MPHGLLRYKFSRFVYLSKIISNINSEEAVLKSNRLVIKYFHGYDKIFLS